MLPYHHFYSLEQAKALMAWAHKGQTRKKSGFLYESHPRRVAAMAAEHGLGTHVVMASLWHDCSEDGPSEIRQNVKALQSKAVIQYGIDEQLTRMACVIVDDLTQRTGESKTEYLERVSNSGKESVLVKVMDRIDNLREGVTTLGDKWLSKYLISSYKILSIANMDKFGISDHACVRYLKEQLRIQSERVNFDFNNIATEGA